MFKAFLNEEKELVSKITNNMYHACSLFHLVSTSRGDILDVGNPYKERYTWKGKYEVMKHSC